jgi:hypothetical protein
VKIVNTLKFSLSNVSAMGVALGVVYLTTGATLIKIGAQSTMHGLGLRGKLTVYK